MKKYLFLPLLALAVFSFSCDPKVDEPTPEPPVSEVIAPIKITAPAAGNVIVAVHVPAALCNDLIAVGTFDWNPENKPFSFTKVSNADGWYQVTLPYAADLEVKVVALAVGGKASWVTQWGMNKEGEAPNVVLWENSVAVLDNSENEGEVRLTGLLDASVTFVDIKAWKSDPCTTIIEEVPIDVIDVVDYTNCELELVGPAIDETNTGAKEDATSGWNWGYTLSAGKPIVDGTTYTWIWNNVALKSDLFKIRTIDFQVSGGAFLDGGFGLIDQENSSMAEIEGVDEEYGNISVKTAGYYKIELTIDASSESKKVVITLIDYTNCELELVGMAIDATNPGAQEDAMSGWLWGYTLSAGKPIVNATTYTWTWSNVVLKPGEGTSGDGFKIRTINDQESGGMSHFDIGFGAVDVENSSTAEIEEVETIGEDGWSPRNINVKTAGNYSVTLVIEKSSGLKKVTVIKL